MTWEELDWGALERLRQTFLTGAASGESYWSSPADLASYDFTYGQRIGWKWDQVLRELKLRGWEPSSRSIFDWGCGSGIASRRVISFFGADRFDRLRLWDQSPLAVNFAAEVAQSLFPTMEVAQATPGQLDSSEPIGLLVISHVLNELAPADLVSLRKTIERAEAVLWVEPGTHLVSRQLSALRDEFSAEFAVVAPCTHQQKCPVFAPERQRDWCHFFAPPPSEIFADSNWVKFGQRAGIDLRSLPYSFIALERIIKTADVSGQSAIGLGTNHNGRANHRSAASPGLSRVIGRPEHFKPYVRLLNCDADGLSDLELPKRSDPALYKELERTKAPLIYRWTRLGNRIESGEAFRKS